MEEKRLPRPFQIYAVTKIGLIISYHTFHRRNRLILKPKINNSGYKVITLCTRISGERVLRYVSVHILVAESYLNKRPSWATQINHIDGKKLNNNIKNLEWSTRKLNGKHASENGLYRVGVRHPKTFFTDKEVKFIKYESKKLGIGICELARLFGRWKGTISRIRNGNTWKHI